MIAAVLLVTCIDIASSTTQTPSIKSCPGSPANSIVAIDDVSVSNVKIGSTMTLKYNIKLNEEISGSPQLVFTMTSGTTKMPCLGDVGSCTYDLCGGTGNVEKQVASSWNNKCPIPKGSYTNSLSIQIPTLAGILIKSDSIHIKIEGKNNGKTLVCVEFDVKVEK